ncbi:putative phage tail protein [Bacillus cereus group sp. BfR-BA-01700]|uniref:putative phage tail protein n=1 Tax=Bacillus cereus group sp. BfR-BA-01700 TaxID=3094884 RepID=UPI0029C13475|nr:putative phage tail protein [Bacillus cereus group sp. BfR-BA-01700]MDX5840158.1 putative phage tail protein [Bacillus cereus group sp. BfR-BA-01700]
MDQREEVLERLLEYSMREYRSSHLFNNLMQIIAEEVLQEKAEFEDAKAQFNIDDVTWGIDDWEREYSIPINEKKPLDQRVSFVLSKMRSAGSTRIPAIKKVAESFEYGQVEVTADIPNYTISIRFVSNYGMPPNIDDIQFALRNIVPAHLSINYLFTYTTWDELEAYNMKWDELEALNLTYDDLSVYTK